MTVRDVSKSNAPGTKYVMFEIQREQRVGLNSGDTYDADLGFSPITRWLAKAFEYDDAISVAGTGMVVRVPVPRGALVLNVAFLLDEAFDQAGSDAVDAGDGNDADGWADGISLQTSVANGRVCLWDVSAAYNTGDAVKGTSGPQMYPDGDTIDVIVGTADDGTAGKAILLMRVISYHEDIEAEW